MAADAWATALTVLGEDAGLALADRLGLAALLLLRGAGGGIEPRVSAAWNGLWA
jgi:thiamine biosynthesis lipoprotein